MAPAAKQPDDSTYSGRFAARLRALREKAGFTGEQAAAAITSSGFTVAMRTYYGWESGPNQAPLNAFPAIAAAFGVKRIRDLLPTE